MRENKGFSLLELIVTIAVLAILGCVLIGTTGVVGKQKLHQCTVLLDGMMKKAKTDTLARNDVNGLNLYIKDKKYYAQIYGETNDGNGNVTYQEGEEQALGNASNIRIFVSNADGSNRAELTKTNNIRIQYARGTGAITAIKVGNSQGDTNRTLITIQRGEEEECIQMIPATGKHSIQ